MTQVHLRIPLEELSESKFRCPSIAILFYNCDWSNTRTIIINRTSFVYFLCPEFLLKIQDYVISQMIPRYTTKVHNHLKHLWEILTAPNILSWLDINYLISWSSPCKLAWITSLVCKGLTMRSNSNYICFTALFYTDNLFKPKAGKIPFNGRTFQITKCLFLLESYGVLCKGLTTNIITCPDYPRCNFNHEQLFSDR